MQLQGDLTLETFAICRQKGVFYIKLWHFVMETIQTISIFHEVGLKPQVEIIALCLENTLAGVLFLSLRGNYFACL